MLIGLVVKANPQRLPRSLRGSCRSPVALARHPCFCSQTLARDLRGLLPKPVGALAETCGGKVPLRQSGVGIAPGGPNAARRATTAKPRQRPKDHCARSTAIAERQLARSLAIDRLHNTPQTLATTPARLGTVATIFQPLNRKTQLASRSVFRHTVWAANQPSNIVCASGPPHPLGFWLHPTMLRPRFLVALEALRHRRRGELLLGERLRLAAARRGDLALLSSWGVGREGIVRR